MEPRKIRPGDRWQPRHYVAVGEAPWRAGLTGSAATARPTAGWLTAARESAPGVNPGGLAAARIAQPGGEVPHAL